MILEKRMVDLAVRYGVDDFTTPKWKAVIKLKERFDKRTGVNIF